MVDISRLDPRERDDKLRSLYPVRPLDPKSEE